MEVFPNIEEIVVEGLKRWLKVQKDKLENISERYEEIKKLKNAKTNHFVCVVFFYIFSHLFLFLLVLFLFFFFLVFFSCISLDNWLSMSPSESAGPLHSHSVQDLFSFLSTLQEGYWEYIKKLQGWGLKKTLISLIELIGSVLSSYTERVIATAKLDSIPQLHPPTDTVKLKQATIEGDNKAKAFVKGLFSKTNSNNNTNKENDDEDGVDAKDAINKMAHVGLALIPLPALCVRVCCIHGAMVRIKKL